MMTIRAIVFPLITAAMVCVTAPTLAQKSQVQLNDPLLESRAASTIVPPKATNEIKIISYNIRWRSGRDLEEIIRWLGAGNDPAAPAIIGLQEVDRARQRSGKTNNARQLADSLGMYYAWAAPPLPKKNKESEEETGVELLSIYPLKDITRLVLPHPGPGGRSRVALGATVKIGNRELRIYSVHSETRTSVSKKMNQLSAVLDDLARFPSLPAVVLGDFNTWEPEAADMTRKLFEGSGFTTPFADNKTTFMRSILGFHLRLKLDWIWLRGLRAKAHDIDRSLTVSDHYPLWTVISLEK